MISAVLSGAAFERTWTDKAGQVFFAANLVGVAAEKVWLDTGDDLLLLALGGFSQTDQDYARGRFAEFQPPAPADPSAEVRYFRYAAGRKLAELTGKSVDESSGIACSRRRPGVFWTHNDSGNDARLYAFDRSGKDLGACLVKVVVAFDWEDMASVVIDGKSLLLVGDIGNNGRHSGVQMIHVVEEPEIGPERGVVPAEIAVRQTINFSYDTAYHDCEALGVDRTTKTILLVTKERRIGAHVYALPWPENNPNKAFVAKRIATLAIEKVTAMDVSPDGLHAVVLTYGDAYQYVRLANEDWSQGFARAPRRIALPPRRQGESICYGPDGKTLYLTSEGTPTPLVEVPIDSAAR